MFHQLYEAIRTSLQILTSKELQVKTIVRLGTNQCTET